jgi:hypothetical protein
MPGSSGVIKITLNGKPFDPDSIEGAIVEMLVDHLREHLGSIRHPETGEFPTIAVTGSNLSNLVCHVEGSPELLALVKERLGEDEGAEDDGQPDDALALPSVSGKAPTAFLSYAFEDSDLARGVANSLMAQGIDTWWAEWCITSGDSIRQKIDDGLGDCSHFIVLLTPRSISKPWVNLEIDAGLLAKLGRGTRFIPLRCDLPVGQLSPLLQTLYSPEVDALTLDVSQVINDIHGLTRKPSLGAPPAAVAASASTPSGYSPAAMALAKFFVEASASGQKFDPQVEPEEVAAKLGLSFDDLSDAIFELKGMVTNHLGYTLFPEDTLFANFDRYWMPWDPSQDALRVAAGLVNDESFPDRPVEMAKVLSWSSRRLNPALAYLCVRGLVNDVRAMDGTDFLAYRIDKTDATRRFVKSRSL